jgi:hypothetical protein
VLPGYCGEEVVVSRKRLKRRLLMERRVSERSGLNTRGRPGLKRVPT